ncbi:DUF6838 family protein [Veillonella caviae]|uniref:phage tail terminator family protein n=1 Tax=Veillonella caviae TaxID=248316 RepID=UPI0023F679D9|nr:hypothetical protein [Veillonella caviae]MCI7693578.1 hypothetical protein [Veillonella caviae]MDY5254036.1 hypothetical protein [Veillonella caviae]
MANRLSQVAIWKAVAKKIHEEYKCTVYSDEVLEEFTMPCFFVKLLMSSEMQTKNFIKRNVTIIATYFPSNEDKDEEQYLTVLDKFLILFQMGFPVGDRYLHVDDIQQDRVGEEDDILQITMDITFMDTTGRIEKMKEEGIMMGDVSLTVEVEDT